MQPKNIMTYIPGWYRDDANVLHPSPTVELYIPWNQTWVSLPPLPTLSPTLDMWFTRIISMRSGSGIDKLFLVGGEHADPNTGVGTYTRQVWTLRHNSSGYYYWYSNSDLDPDMGNYSIV